MSGVVSVTNLIIEVDLEGWQLEVATSHDHKLYHEIDAASNNGLDSFVLSF